MIEWKTLFDQLYEIDSKNNKKKDKDKDKDKKSKNENSLDNYYEITYDNIDELKLGSHIKYINKGRIYNGGFLLRITYDDDIDEIILLVKSNIIWNLKFSKYQVYAKDVSEFNKSTYDNGIFRQIRNEFKEDIELRKNQLLNEQNQIITEIKNNKKKYKIDFV